MSFADRFKKAAEAARDNVAGPDSDHSSVAAHGVYPVDPEPHDLEVASRAMVLGAPDPYSLITRDEVVALTGLPVGGPSLTYTDDDLGVRFDADAGDVRWSFAVHAAHAVDEATPFDPGRWYQWMTELLPAAEQVSLGDSARYSDGLLYVLRADWAFYVQIEAPDGSPVRDWALRLGERVLARLASGVAWQPRPTY